MASDLVTSGTTISGRAKVDASNWQDYEIHVSVIRNDGSILAETDLSDGQADQPFSFELDQPGLYLVAARGHPPFIEELGEFAPSAQGYFTVLVDDDAAESQYLRAAWQALHTDGLGSVPASSVDRNRRITELYSRMYNENEDLRWAGMAAFVSKGAGDAMMSAARGGFGLAVADLIGSLAGFKELPTLGNTAEVRDMVGKAGHLLARGNWEIFWDVYPTFLAYTDAAHANADARIQAVREMKAQNLIEPSLLTAWEKIHQGIIENDEVKKWEGVRLLAVHEQTVSLQLTVMEPNRAFWQQFTNSQGHRIGTPIPGSGRFIDFATTPDMGDANDRLEWIDEELLPKYKAWVLNNPGDIDVQRLLDGRY